MSGRVMISSNIPPYLRGEDEGEKAHCDFSFRGSQGESFPLNTLLVNDYNYL